MRVIKATKQEINSMMNIDIVQFDLMCVHL